MRARPDYSESNPGEVEPYGMDFVNNLAAGEQISSAVLVVIAITGCGVGTNLPLTDGDVSIVTSQVSQIVQNLKGETEYCLTFTIITSFGNKLVAYAHVYCRTPANT